MKYHPLLLTLLLTSCSQVTVDYHMLTSGGYSPEVSGEFFSGHVGAQIHSDQKVVVGQAHSANIFGSNGDVSIDTTPEVKSSIGLGFNAAVGIIEQVQVGLKVNNEATTMLSVQYQFLGTSISAREEGHKFSVALAYGRGSETESNFELNDTNSNSEQKDLSGELELENFELGLQYGYRFNENALIYNSLYYTDYEMEGKISSQAGETFKLQSESWLTSINVGFVITSKKKQALRIQGEVGYSYSKTKNAVPAKHDQANIFLSSAFLF